MSDYVPLSVQYGNRRKKLGWWFKGRCEAMALRLAPWLPEYRDLWEQAEVDRRDADADMRELGVRTLGVLDALDLENSSHAEVRSVVCKLRAQIDKTLRTAPGSDAASLGIACHAKAEDQGEASGKRDSDPSRRDAAKPGTSLYVCDWNATPHRFCGGDNHRKVQ